MEEKNIKMLNELLNSFQKDYNDDVYDTEEDLLKAYKFVLSTLVSNDIITIMQSAEISDKLNKQMLYFKEWY